MTPNRLRSKANAIINLLGTVGAVYSLLLIKFLVGKGDKPNYQPLFLGVAIFMVVAVAVLVCTINEKKIAKKVEAEEKEYMEKEGVVEVVEETTEKTTVLAPEVKRSMGFLLASVAFWFMAYNAVTTAFSRYTQEVWGMENGGFADCLMIATVAAIISYIPIGHISSKIGRKKTIMGGVLLMALCYLGAFFVLTPKGIINVAFALIGVAWAAINVNSYPMVVAMSKGADIGKFTGTYYTFSMSAQIVTPILSGLLLEKVSYTTLFPYAFVFSIFAFITMTQVKHGDIKLAKKASVLDNFDVED